MFEPANLQKLKGCGVAVLDTPSEIIPPVLNYLGEDPNSFDPAVIRKAMDRLQALRPHITYFHSSQYINDLANGDICVTIGWSGDIIQAQDRAEEAGKGVEIAYSIPKEGAPMWFDMLAIPKDAKNVANAHLFINYILRPEVAASLTNKVFYANPNQASLKFVKKDVAENKTIFLPANALARMTAPDAVPQPIRRVQTRIFTNFKAGR